MINEEWPLFRARFLPGAPDSTPYPPRPSPTALSLTHSLTPSAPARRDSHLCGILSSGLLLLFQIFLNFIYGTPSSSVNMGGFYCCEGFQFWLLGLACYFPYSVNSHVTSTSQVSLDLSPEPYISTQQAAEPLSYEDP